MISAYYNIYKPILDLRNRKLQVLAFLIIRRKYDLIFINKKCIDKRVIKSYSIYRHI